MASVTRTLTPEQATAIRSRIIGWSYAPAVEQLESIVTGTAMNSDTGIPKVRDAREALEAIEATLQPFGWQEQITEPVEIAADEDDLRDWAVGAFDSVRERLGSGQSEDSLRGELAADRRCIAQAEALLPLIESLEHAEGLAAP